MMTPVSSLIMKAVNISPVSNGSSKCQSIGRVLPVNKEGIYPGSRKEPSATGTAECSQSSAREFYHALQGA